MHADQERQFAGIDVADPSEVSLIEQGLRDGSTAITQQIADGQVGVPVLAQQVGPEVTDHGVLARGGEEIDGRQQMPNRPPPLSCQHEAHCVPHPPGLGVFDAPGAIHAQMSVQRPPIVEPHQEVFATGAYVKHGRARDAGGGQLRDAKVAFGNDLPGQCRVQSVGCPPDGVTLRHD